MNKEELKLMEAIHNNYKISRTMNEIKKIKERHLRKWVVYVLAIINVISLIIMGSDCDSLKLFIVTHFIACGVFAINSLVLYKYGKDIR